MRLSMSQPGQDFEMSARLWSQTECQEVCTEAEISDILCLHCGCRGNSSFSREISGYHRSAWTYQCNQAAVILGTHKLLLEIHRKDVYGVCSIEPVAERRCSVELGWQMPRGISDFERFISICCSTSTLWPRERTDPGSGCISSWIGSCDFASWQNHRELSQSHVPRDPSQQQRETTLR